jgi:hypothetical protein
LAALALFVVASKFSLRHMEDFEMNWLAWFALEAAGICFALAVIIWLIANRFR